jgi:hypothetical protein
VSSYYPYREGAGLKLEADGLSLSVLRPWENPNFDYNASLVTGTASPVIGDPDMGIWKRLDNTLTGGIFLNHNSVVDQADMEAYSNTPLFGIDGLTHGDVYDVTTTAAEYLGYAELGLSAGSLKTFVRNLDADNAKYAADDMGSGNPLGIGQAPDNNSVAARHSIFGSDGTMTRLGDAPVIKQPSGPFCGPTSCAMVLESAGKKVDVNELISQLDKKVRIGTSIICPTQKTLICINKSAQ